VQGKDPSVDFTQDIVEESEDERCFDDMNDSVPPIELPPCELARLTFYGLFTRKVLFCRTTQN
jgi:protein phosphatase-4 regulatory subunit 3